MADGNPDGRDEGTTAEEDSTVDSEENQEIADEDVRTENSDEEEYGQMLRDFYFVRTTRVSRGLIDEGEPESYREALRHRDTKQWELAIHEELRSLTENKT